MNQYTNSIQFISQVHVVFRQQNNQYILSIFLIRIIQSISFMLTTFVLYTTTIKF